jgi:hypothetical protein
MTTKVKQVRETTQVKQVREATQAKQAQDDDLSETSSGGDSSETSRHSVILCNHPVILNLFQDLGSNLSAAFFKWNGSK